MQRSPTDEEYLKACQELTTHLVGCRVVTIAVGPSFAVEYDDAVGPEFLLYAPTPAALFAALYAYVKPGVRVGPLASSVFTQQSKYLMEDP